MPVTVAAPNDVVSYNVGVVSNYRFRSISQTRVEPIVQGGALRQHPNRFIYRNIFIYAKMN
ncbi:TorF family putative porin [Glaciimonas sp. PAMC28666]|uniref:TorF family putative porin n=1 Tax=Glaciimonas sp. PAMC28666 TaxID=2807626 RepID=UPI00351CB074